MGLLLSYCLVLAYHKIIKCEKRPDLQELEAHGARKGGSGKADAPQGTDQQIDHRGEPQPRLVGAHDRRGSAVGVDVELALLDAVFHVGTGAVNALVDLPRARLAALERDDGEARIGLALVHSALKRRGAGGSRC